MKEDNEQMSDDLKKKIIQFEKTEIKLKASNQQLSATEQQLRAANQQLEANNLQLLANELQLIRTQDILRQTILQSPQGMALMSSIDYKFKIINKAAENFLMINADDYLDKTPDKMEITWQNYMPDGQKMEPDKDPTARALNGVTTHNLEHRTVRRDGTSKWALASATPIYDSIGKQIAVLLVLQDITERKLAEKALKESEAKFHILTDNMKTGLVLHGADTKILFCNSAASDILGLSNEQLKGKIAIDPAWKFFRENGSPLPLEEYPVNIVLASKNPLQDYIIGINIPETDYPTWVLVNATPVFSMNKDLSYVSITFENITERKQAEEALKDSESNLRQIIDLVPHFIYVKDEDGKDLIVNKAVADAYGTTVEDIIGKSDMDITPDKENAKNYIKDDLEVIHSGKQKFIPEEQITDSKGNIRFLETTKIPFETSMTNKRAILGVSIDITKRKQAEEALIVSEEQYRLLATNTLDTIWTTDTEFNLTFVNDAIFNFLGYTPEVFIGLNPSVFTTVEGMKTIQNAAEQLVVKYKEKEFNQSIFEIQQIKKDGTLIDVEIRANLLLDSDEKLIGFQGRSVDITERKKAEEKLKEKTKEAQLLADMLDKSSQPFAVGSIGGKLSKVNTAFCNLTGYSKEELLNDVSWNETLTPKEWREYENELLQKAITTGESQLFEKEYIHKNGKRISVELLMHIKFDDNNNLQYVYGFISDITDRKQVEKTLIAQHNLATKLNIITKFDEMLVQCLETAINISAMDCGGIYLVDEKGGLELKNNKGLPADFIKNSSYYTPDSQNTKLIMKGKPIYSRHWELDIDLSDNRKKEVLKAIAVVPISFKGKVIACFNVASHTLNEVPLYSRNPLETIAGQIGSVISRMKAEKALQESEEKHRKLIETTSEGFWLVSSEKKTIDVNQSLCEMLGYSKDEMIGKTPFDFVDEVNHEIFVEQFIKSTSTKHRTYEISLKKKDGTNLLTLFNATSIADKNEKHVGSFTFVTDITELKQAEEEIKKNLAEKTVLIQEIYHRTKNNMAVISAMLSIQSRRSKNDYVKSTFREIRNKIQAMALVHQKLYKAKDLSNINLKDYIEDLAKLIEKSYGILSKKIKFKLEMQNVKILIDSAVPLGLIINELVSNIFKHAFPNRQEGEIFIRLFKEKDKTINLELIDNGIGFPQNFDPRKDGSMGLASVFSIVENQLKGEISVKSENGLKWHIKIKDDKKKERV